VGFFPLEVTRQSLHVPVRTLSFWQHPYCFLTTPLLHAAHARQALDAFWRWVEANPFSCHIFDTNKLLAEGRFHELWSDFALGRPQLVLSDYARAALYPEGSADAYKSRTISKKHLKEYRRLENHLRQMGRFEYSSVQSEAELEPWIDAFLAVEAAGWKGQGDGGAFALGANDTNYFRKIARAGFAQGSVMLLSMTIDGQPIALKFNLLSGNAGFAFKIAFDESYSKYSPGALLELENIRVVSDVQPLQWMDSCAVPRHPMADRLWGERRMIRRTLFSCGTAFGDFLISALPLLRWLHGRLRPRPANVHFQISTQSNSNGDHTHGDSSRGNPNQV
jgi:CelD/BcsL family acetyltransferase involved in cellulose biosynthesis